MRLKHKLISALLIFTMTVTMTAGTTVTASGASSKASKYWLKVNAQANVVTVYKKVNKKWKPYRAMLCSTGTGKGDSYEATPVGNFRVTSRWDWGPMVGGVYARYVVQFYGDFLFHSVPYDEYRNPKSMPAKEYNKLGKDASHGCVRLSLMDAKWVYDNIPRGTKVTVYNSRNPGPLGKPAGIKLPKKPKLTWDPTDTNRKNKKYQLPKPVITISGAKKTLVKYGSSYQLKAGVTAKDPNTFQNLTGLVTVSKVRWYDSTAKKYVVKTFSTKRCGTYKVTYKVKYKYGGTTYQTLKIRVAKPLDAPVINGSTDSTARLITLSWAPVKNASTYVIYRSDAAKGPYRNLCTTAETVFVDATSVEPGKTYYYKIKPVSSNRKYASFKYSNVITQTIILTGEPSSSL